MVNEERLPRHVAVVMDGNGRWAKKNGKNKLFGHEAGLKAMKAIVKRSSDLGIQYLTVYAFSTENWKRSKAEVSGIFHLLLKYLNLELDELHENNIVFKVIGDYKALPKNVVRALDHSFEKTKNNTGLQFIVAFNYGSRAEIVMAAQRLAREAENGTIEADAITESDFCERLYTSDIPDPDLVIRTSGEERLSNFLLWQAAYSEFVFTDVLWPDFSPEEYDRCLEIYGSRERRFGGR
ncbi:MAG: isoprenyl transferase [Clostridiales Family XIII bacterium]|jgi:undecaprenyl diphosphate synthase|nr:isoprenyl transferase [Clostridiales Family XIII bacterium]